MIRPVKPTTTSTVMTSTVKTVVQRGAVIGAAVSLIGLAYACEDDTTTTDNGATSNPTTSSGASGGMGGDGGTGNNGGLQFGGNMNGGSGGDCVNLDLEPELESLPSDIVFVIDNSGSMSDEIALVESNINTNFASIIGMSGIDYQVIMLTNHGTGSTEVCITGALSGGVTDCTGAPGDTPTFHQYDLDVQSLDSMCLILDTFYGSNNGGEPDQQGLHPEGWSKWLRPEAVKVFVEISDDGINCTWNNQGFNVTFGTGGEPAGQNTATLFDNTLLSLSPLHFGTTLERKYQFYSIVGLTAKAAPFSADPYLPVEPVATTTCSCPASGMPPPGCPANQSTTAYSAGSGYQWLSKGTKALRFPVCNTGSYDAVFQDIAAGVIKATSVPCEFDLPPPGNGQEPDLNSLQLVYEHGDMSATEEFDRVPSEAACGVLDDAFWLDESTDPDRVHLCPNACDKVTDDELAEIKVRYQCGGIQ
jgi:hypothetical protein